MKDDDARAALLRSLVRDLKATGTPMLYCRCTHAQEEHLSETGTPGVCLHRISLHGRTKCCPCLHFQPDVPAAPPTGEGTTAMTVETPTAPPAQPAAKTQTCPECGVTVAYKGLGSHMARHRPKRYTTCPVCKDKINVRGIAAHRRTHSPAGRAQLSAAGTIGGYARHGQTPPPAAVRAAKGPLPLIVYPTPKAQRAPAASRCSWCKRPTGTPHTTACLRVHGGPRTPATKVERGRRGGIASGIARRSRSVLNSHDLMTVPRPATPARSDAEWLAIVDAVVATATTGQAVRIPLNDKQANEMGNALRASLRKRGLVLHYRSSLVGRIDAWADRA